jgi:hypothetical protein
MNGRVNDQTTEKKQKKKEPTTTVTRVIKTDEWENRGKS